MVKVFITRKVPEEGFNLLKENGYSIRFYDDKVISRKELLDAVKWADALCSMITDKIDREIMFANPDLKIISNYGVGFDNIDLKSASERKLPITNTPDVLTDATAEHTIALMISLARSIPEADNFTRSGKYRGWSPNIFLGSDLKGKTLGIIGFGRIGKAVAKIALDGFGMDVVYYNKKIDEGHENKNIKFTELDILLKTADFVSIHVPLSESTKYLIDSKKLSLMKSDSYLINTSRGPVVNEKDLVEVSKNKKISGAALDVFENEPEITPGLDSLKNVILTPHIGSATVRTRRLMAEMVSKNIIAAVNGEIPPNVINKEIYKK